MRKFLAAAKRLGDVNPIVMLSWVMGITAFSMPFVVVPVRRALGFQTNQYDKKTPKSSTAALTA